MGHSRVTGGGGMGGGGLSPCTLSEVNTVVAGVKSLKFEPHEAVATDDEDSQSERLSQLELNNQVKSDSFTISGLNKNQLPNGSTTHQLPLL